MNDTPRTRSSFARPAAHVAKLTALLATALVGCSAARGTGETATPSARPCSPAANAPAVAAAPAGESLAALPRLSFHTVFAAPLVIEGLTADAAGNLYAAGRAGTPECPVWRVSPAGHASVVGRIPAPCSPSGLAFSAAGDLFVADGATVYRLTPKDGAPPVGSVFARGVPGANGVAFDRSGRLWVSDGTTGQGRVWTVSPDGAVSESFRVQPLANLVNATSVDAGRADAVGGVGRDSRALPPGALKVSDTARAAVDTAGSVDIVANGLAFAPDGTLFVADTARGAIWKVNVDASGRPTSRVGCDTTFPADTLCLDDLLVEHPILEGLDGIALDEAGNIWGVANERNAVVVVDPAGHVREAFRNPPDPADRLRNGGPLEFPTSPFLVGRVLCVTQSDASRRDNFPNSGGEVGPAAGKRAKISCTEAVLPSAGLPLPLPLR